MIKALLFDLDGTLFDSKVANIKAYTSAFNDVGITLDEDRYKSLFGLKYVDMIKTLQPKIDSNTMNKIQDLKSDYYLKYISLVTPNLALIQLIRSVRGKFKIGLVTTASEINVTNLIYDSDLTESMFDVIVTGENVKKGKPDPECYILAFTKLGLKAQECCIFEDSKVGIEAAKLSGAYTIKVSI